jgi:diadenosine tetraphosphate (Ap4A) HIT family hydrolase
MLFQNENVPDNLVEHLHMHVVPRRPGDDFRLPEGSKGELTHDERVDQASRVAQCLDVSKA